MEKKIQRILKKLEIKMKTTKSKSNYPKLLALTYLAVAIEKIMQNPKNNKPLSDLSKLVDNASKIYEFYLEIDRFAGTKNSQFYSIKAVHKDLWVRFGLNMI